jgi:hypothetical protein
MSVLAGFSEIVLERVFLEDGLGHVVYFASVKGV